MIWEKKGLIYNPTGGNDWDNNSFLTPTPLILSNQNFIRIYGGIRDKEGRSRIGYIDVDINNPSNIIHVSQNPVLDLGLPGTFDDNGVILGAILNEPDHIKMYYVGFQLVKNVKFLAFSGLAVSKDGGDSFQRIQTVPVFDRFDDEIYIRAIHSVIKEDNVYKIWYSYSNSWQVINNISYPAYNIRYVESRDGVNPDITTRRDCIHVKGDEYRIGRPVVRKVADQYEMFYTKDTLQKNYHSGIGYSDDGKEWVRKDHDFKLKTSASGWDSKMICYPYPLIYKNKEYLFYSGNNMGLTGVGYAERKLQ
jgi:hypothetical protein